MNGLVNSLKEEYKAWVTENLGERTGFWEVVFTGKFPLNNSSEFTVFLWYNRFNKFNNTII